ncbi:MAG: hypothetical protein A2Z71_01730 [Chloroflexi bacterium RBG_13_50_21]|nr:MAG: hypothetical protein A2Z71_01730 [Chloroflexi bacterium RBG_13_50_21]
MDENFDAHLAALHEPMKRALVELVRIPSVCEEGAGGYLFGEAVNQALRKALQMAADLGFRTQYGDGGYYGYAEVGQGKEMLGILGHLDVVLAGKMMDWKRDPFDPAEEDGMLYGRGRCQFCRDRAAVANDPVGQSDLHDYPVFAWMLLSTNPLQLAKKARRDDPQERLPPAYPGEGAGRRENWLEAGHHSRLVWGRSAQGGTRFCNCGLVPQWHAPTPYSLGVGP